MSFGKMGLDNLDSRPWVAGGLGPSGSTRLHWLDRLQKAPQRPGSQSEVTSCTCYRASCPNTSCHGHHGTKTRPNRSQDDPRVMPSRLAPQPQTDMTDGLQRVPLHAGKVLSSPREKHPTGKQTKPTIAQMHLAPE